jgi:hypothetical protein
MKVHLAPTPSLLDPALFTRETQTGSLMRGHTIALYVGLPVLCILTPDQSRFHSRDIWSDLDRPHLTEAALKRATYVEREIEESHTWLLKKQETSHRRLHAWTDEPSVARTCPDNDVVFSCAPVGCV